MDEDFAGTQLYRQRVCFLLPLCLLALYQHNQWKKNFKVDDWWNLFLFFDKLVLIILLDF